MNKAAWIGAVVLTIIIFIIASDPAPKWNEGGTLHAADAKTWVTATPENKLATAGDWVATYVGKKEMISIGFDGLKALAGQLVSCLNTALPDGTSTTPVAEAATACMVQLKMPSKD